MRRTTVPLLLLFAATSIFAADAPERWRMSVLRVQHGFTCGIAYVPRPDWSIEAGVSEQNFEMPVTTFGVVVPGVGALPVTTFRNYTIHPVDLFVSRHFAREARLSPYVRAGARYVDAPGGPVHTIFVAGPGGSLIPATFGAGLPNRASAEVGTGALLRLTRRTALRVDATRLLRSDSQQYDPLTRLAAGVSWHF